jgi:hypothetical protein
MHGANIDLDSSFYLAKKGEFSSLVIHYLGGVSSLDLFDQQTHDRSSKHPKKECGSTSRRGAL